MWELIKNIFSMDPLVVATIIAAIIGAIILGVFTIIGAFISRSRKKEKSKEEEKISVTQLPITPKEKSTLTEGIPTPPVPYIAHPYPLQENFTGRLSERNELTEWFANSDKPMFAYVAIGGMGKSAVTWYWLHEDIIKKGLAPEGIIWWSFYDREARFETFLMKAIQYASNGKVDVKKIESTRDRMDTLYNLLCEKRFLLVLDGVERVLRAYAGLGSPYQGDELKKDEKDFRACIDPNVGTFLQWLAGQDIKTKTLLTSRLCPKEMDDVEGCLHRDLMEMPEEDAVEFFHRQGVKGTRAEIENACEHFGYHPLSLRLLSGMILKDPRYNADISAWTRYNPLPELKGKEHNILELAYNSLNPQKQTLISKISAFRNPMEYDSIRIFNEFKTGKEFDDALIELKDRGLLLRDNQTNRYDLHPIIRKYCYDRLVNKKDVHTQLSHYFAKIPELEKIESLDDLAPVIELYHHTVHSGKYDEAWELYRDRLWQTIFYRFGAYKVQIELLEALFKSPTDELPNLSKEALQAHACNELANSYSLSGQPKKAVRLFKKQNELAEKAGDKMNLAIGIANLSDDQMKIGDFKSAEANLLQSIRLSQEIKHELTVAYGHFILGQLYVYQSRFEESVKEHAESEKYCREIDYKQAICTIEAYRAHRALIMSDAEQALNSAKRAREIADVGKVERDIIRAEWLLGASCLAKGDLKEAEKHLNEALVRDRRINLVDLEPDILLGLAKLRFAQKHKEEALELAKEALGIADRCEYRLKQADIHNFLAEFYIDAKNLAKAKEHIKIAKERAECGYKPAMEKAEKLAKSLEEESKKV